jgi:hypothetical protein
MAGTRRTPIARARYSHLSAEVLRLFAHAMNREAAGLERGSPEHNRIAVALHRALARRPWDTDLLSIDVDTPPPRDSDSTKLRSWATAIELRRQLVQMLSDVPPAGSREATLANHPQ